MCFKHKWYILHCKLYNLGFFYLKKHERPNNFISNAVVAFHTQNYYGVHSWYFYKVIKKIVPIFSSITYGRPNVYFFFLGTRGEDFFKQFFSILHKSTMNIIFDWGFGIITNRMRMFVNYYIEERFCHQEQPEIAFLLSVLGRQKVVTTELRNAQLLSTGLTEYGDIGFVDFPIPASVSLNYVYIFFKLAARLVVRHQRFFAYARN